MTLSNRHTLIASATPNLKEEMIKVRYVNTVVLGSMVAASIYPSVKTFPPQKDKHTHTTDEPISALTYRHRAGDLGGWRGKLALVGKPRLDPGEGPARVYVATSTR